MKHRSSRRAVVCIVSVLAMAGLAGCAGKADRTGFVNDGVADLSAVDFSRGSVSLRGKWLLFPDEILAPEEVELRLAGNSIQPVPVSVPGLWNEQSFNEKRGKKFGTGTMVLTVRAPLVPTELALRMALSQGSSRIYVNGVHVDGTLVTDPALYGFVPPGNPRYIRLPSGCGDLRIVVQKVNWWDSFGSGIMAAPTIGSADEMSATHDFNVGYESLLVGCLLFCALYHLMLFLVERRDRALLLFSLISAAVLLRQLSIGEKFWMSMAGVRHFALLRVEHGSAYLVCALFVAYFTTLYRDFSARWLRLSLVAAGAFGVAMTLVPDPRLFTGMITYLHAYIGLSAAFCCYLAIRAIRANGEQAWAMLIGLCTLAIPTFLDILSTYRLTIIRYVMPLGFVPFVLIESYVLARRYARGTREAERLRVQAARLEELDRAKTAFIANVAHELRTPITLIKTPVEALRAGDYGEKLSRDHHVFAVIENNANRLLRLVENFLMMTRLDSGAALETRPTDLASLVSRYVGDVAPMAEKSRVAVALDIERDSPETPIVADIDARAFDIVFFNLLTNAIKFSFPDATVTVTLSVEGAAPRRTVVLSVKDTGIGIPRDALPRLFSRYARVYDGERADYDGNGIGLSLARETARALGGDIAVRSEEGKGSVFTLTLPESASGSAAIRSVGPSAYAKTLGDIRRAGATGTAGTSAPGVAAAPQRAADRAGDRTRVLVVEDNADMRRFVAESLSAEYDVVEAKDGMDAKELLTRLPPPDLVVCDVMMPRMDGHALFRFTRSDDLLSSIPFIMLTARDEGDEKVRSLREGAVDYIVKPFRVDELRARISAIVGGRKADRESLRRKMESMLREMLTAGGQREAGGEIEARSGADGPTGTRERSRWDLSPREEETLTLVVSGMTDKEIARSLGISVRTASNHVASILRKTGTAGRGELVANYGDGHRITERPLRAGPPASSP